MARIDAAAKAAAGSAAAGNVPPRTGAPDRILKFHYQARDVRSVPAAGALVAVTPSGMICVSVFSERLCVPDMNIFPVNEDGTLDVQQEMTGKRLGSDGVSRTIEVELFMPREIAEIIGNSLLRAALEHSRDG